MPLICAPIVRRRGLGNELFAVARCLVASHIHDLSMGAPIWRQVHIGPYLRRESDKRQYHRIFRPSNAEIPAWRWLPLAISGARVRERDLSSTDLDQRGVALFDGYAEYFRPIWGYHSLVVDYLHEVTRGSVTPRKRAEVAVHVRLGDFASADDGVVSNNTRLPVRWYAARIGEAKELLGNDTPVHIYSDGQDQELAPLLSIPGCVRARPGNAMLHMLSMAESALLIAGNSTFSAWAAYLGQTPLISHAGFDHYRTRPETDISEAAQFNDRITTLARERIQTCLS